MLAKLKKKLNEGKQSLADQFEYKMFVAFVFKDKLYEAATMNNTLCLGIFCALVYFKNLEWYFSAEVAVILLVQWFVLFMGYPLTYKLWKILPVAFFYIFSIIVCVN